MGAEGRKPGARRKAAVAPATVNTLRPAFSNIYVIGSISPGEIQVHHEFQFVNAAVYRGLDDRTLCIVERTGYERGGVVLSSLEAALRPARIVWVTPQVPLVVALNALPAGSIRRLVVFSHGLPGMLTLRYGWDGAGAPNYGLSIPEVVRLRKEPFHSDVEIEFNSCNTGSQTDDGILAQELATHLDRPVKAWMGRTSYTDVNDGMADGTADILPSEIWRGSLDTTEMLSQWWDGRVPRLIRFLPAYMSPGHFAIQATETIGPFSVPSAGSVMIVCTGARYTSYSFAEPENEFSIELYRGPLDGLVPSSSISAHVYPVQESAARHTWSNLQGGWYYVIISKGNAHAFLGREILAANFSLNVSRP